MIDYKKPTAQMLGRWQPFHDGHIALFKKILKKTGQVQIMVRTMPKSDNNPFEFEEIKKRIEEKLKDYIGKFEVLQVANITNICYGRDVGYKIEEIILPKEIQKISATKIRNKLK
jgi:nicotinamide mononucleotide adenylyltransferase